MRKSETESLSRAALICDPSLVDVGFGQDPRLSLTMRVMALGGRDETTARRCVASLFDGQGKRKEALLDELDWLCLTMSELHDGLVRLKAGFLPRRLARLIAPDHLFLFHPKIELPAGELFDWPAVPILDGGDIDGLFRDESLETHIHLGGSLPPLFYWCPLISGWLPLDCLRGVPAPHRGHAEVEDWQIKLGEAMWLRLQIAAELDRRFERARFPRLFPWLPVAWHQRSCFLEKAEPPKSPDDARDLAFALALEHPSCDLDFLGESRAADDWPWIDPLRPVAERRRPHYAAGERRLFYAAARQLRLEQSGKVDPIPFFGERVRRYLCIHNAFHRLLIFDFGNAGLGRFVESFDRRWRLAPLARRNCRRQKRLRRILARFEQARMTSALDSQLLDPFVDTPETGYLAASSQATRRIELRVSIPRLRDISRTLNAWVGGIAEHLLVQGDHLARGAKLVIGKKRKLRNSQIGLVFHFIKSRAPEESEACQAAIDAAERLAYVLDEYPFLRPFVVGIDGAGFERDSHPRIFASAYRDLFARCNGHRPGPGEPPIRLGATFHVGEDVEDFLTGLRHLDETCSLLLPARGGRLGHALALSDNPRDFYSRHGCREPPLGVHVLDLVWAWGRMGSLGVADQEAASFVPLIEQWLRLACPQKSLRIADCWHAMGLAPGQDLPTESILETRLQEILEISSEPSSLLPTPVPSEDENWLRLLESSQRFLRHKLASRAICVEANPSSNLLIGRYAGYASLPCIELTKDQILFSLNTDDPGLFMTTLPGEFAAMYQALSRSMTHRATMDWLKARITDAKDSTFLGAHVPSGNQAFKLACRGLRPPRYGFGPAWQISGRDS